MVPRSIAMAGLGAFAWLAAASTGSALTDGECFECHDDPDIEMEADDGAERSAYVDPKVFQKSIHGKKGCVSCHSDVRGVPHDDDLASVRCERCHREQQAVYADSLHGISVSNNDPLAPHCWDCHGKHNITGAKDPQSWTNPVNIPETCGRCHAEDAPVARSRNVKQHNILRHYEESIHGEGVNKKGLSVTAVCSSCHTAHRVFPHTDPRSSIHRDNVVGTCTQCHGLIEQVHRKVIDGALWEKEPHRIPVCVDCHEPHEARKIYYDEGVSDRDCLRCHARALERAGGDPLPALDVGRLARSAHFRTSCAQCHTGVDPSRVRSCQTVIEKVNCATCHAQQVQQHQRSIHGKLLAKGDKDAPGCEACHQGHGIQSKTDPSSPIFPKNVPQLCGKCHREGEKAARRNGSLEHHVVEHFSMSIHGKGLLESGLVVTATCTSCHTAHQPLAAKDSASSVNPKNVAHTCGRCHSGIEEQLRTSVHSPLVTKTDEKLPVCSGCHTAHDIRRTDKETFKANVMATCGRCHQDVAQTYFETYHGKVSKLGEGATAKCHDCHGAHDVLKTTDRRSHLSRENIVTTCGKCHEGSHRRFAGYLTHATHHDPEKYPMLFWSFWAMTGLLLVTFGVFGLHTLVWLPRSFRERFKLRKKAAPSPDETPEHDQGAMFQRFQPSLRQMHFGLIITFFGLALTGMALKFSYMPWAQALSTALGGIETMGATHRLCACVMILIFAIHLLVVAHHRQKAGVPWKQLLLGPSSLMPAKRDWDELVATVKWFLRRGPRPQYGQWTYWEKFDYFAVFWGIAVIGSTGVILWFPEVFTHFLPGWFINVAMIIHSDEALLATGFIFTIHFFNTHFRPDKFPMDMVMFTGRMSVEELKHERPKYYEELVASGELEKRLVPPAPKEFRYWAAVFGTCALVVGFSLVVFIAWSMLFGYR